MKVRLITDEKYPVLLESEYAQEIDLPDDLVTKWRAAKDAYGKAELAIFDYLDTHYPDWSE